MQANNLLRVRFINAAAYFLRILKTSAVQLHNVWRNCLGGCNICGKTLTGKSEGSGAAIGVVSASDGVSSNSSC